MLKKVMPDKIKTLKIGITLLGFCLLIGILPINLFDSWDFRNNLWGPAHLLTTGRSPYFIKQLPRRKTDVKDAQWIATVLQKELIKGSFIPDQIIACPRQYGRCIFKLVRQKVSVEQSIDRQLQRCNIRISNYISTTDSRASCLKKF